MTDRPLVWLDIETTGIDPKDHLLLEVAVQPTDWDFEPLAPALTLMVNQPVGLVQYLMDDVVRDMHLGNGLVDDLVDGRGKAPWLVEDELRAHLEPLGQFHWAGSGVDRFDIPWLNLLMPELAALAHYRAVDLSSTRTFMQGIGLSDVLPPQSDTSTRTHRALDDVRHEIEEAKALRTLLEALR